MQYRDDEQQPDDSANTAADEERRKAMQDSLASGSQGITDPPVESPDPSYDTPTPGAPAPDPAAPAAPPAAPAAPASGSVGAGTPWAPGASQPTGAPAGYHWDASMANYVADAAPAATSGGGPPTGGSLTDPSYAQQFVQYWGNQPGANPSVKTDPAYWVGRFTSGAFGNDQQYAIKRMMQAEGPPEGATAAAPAVTGGQARTQTAAGGGNTITAGSLPGSPSNNQFGDDIRRQLLALLNQAPVDENDPDIAGAISANKVATERSLAQENDQIAEQAYAQRLGGAGSTQASMQAARERTGAGQGAFAGNLVAQQAIARKNQITQLLQVGAGVMTADQQQKLQAEIAKMDAILRQESITNQNNQANDQLGYQYDTFQANMNRNSVLDAMGVHL